MKVDRLLAFGSDTLLASTSYITDSDRGMIYRRDGAFIEGEPSPRAVQVVYVTNTAVPNDVKEAYAVLVGHWYRHMKTQVAAQNQNVTQQTFGSATSIFAKDQIAGLPLPHDVQRLLQPYRDPVL